MPLLTPRVARAFRALELLACVPASGQMLTWHERAPLPRPRAGYMAGVIHKQFVIAGGSYWEGNQKRWVNAVHIFDPARNTWTEAAPLPEARSDAANVSYEDVLYLFGGGAEGSVRRDALMFRDGKWSPIPSAELPEPRLYAVAVVCRGMIYLLGGMPKAGDYTSVSNAFWVWDPRSPEAGWKILDPVPGPGLITHAMVEVSGKIYVLGGAKPGGADVVNVRTVYEFDPERGKWTRLPDLPIERRCWWGVESAGKILLIGGYTTTYEREVFAYTLGSRALEDLAPLPHGLCDAKFFRIGNSIIGTGGEAADRVRGAWTFEASLTPGKAAIRPLAPRVLSGATVFVHPSSDPYDRKNFYGFNHAPSVVALPDGRLLAAWFSGPFEASVDQLILASYSADGGRTWTSPVVLQDFPRKSDFDPAFIADGPRTWFFFSAGRENRYPVVHDEKHEVGVDSFTTFCRLTQDSGRTWSEPRAVKEKVYCRSNGIRLSTGELLLPIYEIPSRGGVLKSTDAGMTWKRYGAISTQAGAGEPSIAELRSGAIMMVLRTTDGFLWKTSSTDKGETWSSPIRTKIAAATTSHNLFRLSDGRLLLTLNESSPSVRTPLTMRISDDDGESWGESAKLAEIALPAEGEKVWAREVCYPSVAQLKDGSLVVVWAKLVLSDAEQFGDIESARVQVR